MLTRSFPSELKHLKYEVRKKAEEAGLDAFEVIFEVVDYKTMNEVAAYQGFPTRYPHWRWGMAYEQLKKSYVYGLSTIYELVVNNDPCYAYLLESNEAVTQKMVMSHVYGHADFFKNNLCFSKTNRKMMDEMANHASRIRRFAERYGSDRVERFIDVCLSLENLIDIHAPFIRRSLSKGRTTGAEDDGETKSRRLRLRSKEYMESFINPPVSTDGAGTDDGEGVGIEPVRIPREPVRDVMAFLAEHAPLEDWQREVMEIVREEAYYFAPQAQTKIMNEGWASYWHSKLMTEGLARDEEIVDYAVKHAGVTATPPSGFNPYKIGVELFRDIEERWDRGRFGLEYESCDSFVERRSWDRQLGLGREKIFEVRRLYSDVTFIDEFLTEDFCRDHNLFSFSWNSSADRYEIESREFAKIKKRFLFQLTNAGNPIIDVVDANHGNRGELLLMHRFEGVELDREKAKGTLENLYKIWTRPVYIESKTGKNKRLVLSFDGSDFKEETSDA